MLNKKLVATVLTATMIFGSCFTVMADDVQGTGTSFDHLNTDIIEVTYPTSSETANIFNYHVDPERLVNAAGAIADGTTNGTTVAGNEDGVYFNKTNSASSNAVYAYGNNSVDIDLSVTATVTAADTDIALVEDEAALESATAPSLLLKLIVGETKEAITGTGVTAKATVAGVSSNFVTAVSGNNYKYTTSKAGNDASWNKAVIQLSGKTNEAEVPDGSGSMTAPTIKLTWSAAKHVDGYVSTTTISAASNSVSLTLPDGVTLTKIELLKSGATSTIEMKKDNHYTLSGTTYTFTSSMLSAWTGGKLTFKYSDGKSEVVTIQ